VQRSRRTAEAAAAGYSHERPDLVHVHDDIQVADAGAQNYALDKCAMPADFGEERVFARLEPRGPHFSSFETRPKGRSSSNNGEAVTQG
jgi:hypothetical protein